MAYIAKPGRPPTIDEETTELIEKIDVDTYIDEEKIKDHWKEYAFRLAGTLKKAKTQMQKLSAENSQGKELMRTGYDFHLRIDEHQNLATDSLDIKAFMLDTRSHNIREGKLVTCDASVSNRELANANYNAKYECVRHALRRLVETIQV